VGTKFFVRGRSLKNKYPSHPLATPGGQWQYYFFHGVVASPGILEIPEVFFRVFGKMCFDQDVVASPGILEIPEVFFRVFGKMCFDQDVVASPEILEIPEVFFRVFGIFRTCNIFSACF